MGQKELLDNVIAKKIKSLQKLDVLSFFQDVSVVVAEVALTQSLSPASFEVAAQLKVDRIFNLGQNSVFFISQLFGNGRNILVDTFL